MDLLRSRWLKQDRWHKLLALAAAALAGTIGARSAEVSPERLRLRDLAGREVRPLGASSARVVVFLFARTDCPISNRYAPEVRHLYEKFSPSRVSFWLVYPDSGDSPAAIQKHIKEYGYPFGALRDPQHALVKFTGVQVTPEAAVFVRGPSGAQMVYRGRIDDRYVDFGKTRPEPTTHDLKQVLDNILEEKPVKLETTPAIGCFIPDLK